MKILLRILQGILAIGFIMFGFMKLSANPTQVDAFTNIYEYGSAAMYVVGAIEVISGIGLLIGFKKTNLVSIFSALLAIVMAGAVFTHFKAGQGFSVASMPFILFVLAVILYFGHKKEQKNKGDIAK